MPRYKKSGKFTFIFLPSAYPYAIIRVNNLKGSGAVKVRAESLWKIFEQTGSIAIYMFYRRISLQ